MNTIRSINLNDHIMMTDNNNSQHQTAAFVKYLFSKFNRIIHVTPTVRSLTPLKQICFIEISNLFYLGLDSIEPRRYCQSDMYPYCV